MTTEQCWYRHRARKHTSWRCIRIDPHIRQRAKLDGSDGELRIRPAMGETFGPAECGRPSALWCKTSHCVLESVHATKTRSHLPTSTVTVICGRSGELAVNVIVGGRTMQNRFLTVSDSSRQCVLDR
jgi:hypothetical protein